MSQIPRAAGRRIRCIRLVRFIRSRRGDGRCRHVRPRAGPPVARGAARLPAQSIRRRRPAAAGRRAGGDAVRPGADAGRSLRDRQRADGAARRRIPAGHGLPGARRADRPGPRRPRHAAGGRGGGGAVGADRGDGGRAGRLLRRLDRRGADARHRVLPGAAHAAVRHGAGDAVLAVAGDDRHRHRRGQLDRHGAAGARRVPAAQAARVRAGRARHRRGRRAHHLASDPAQRAGAADRVGHAGGGHGGVVRGRTVVPGAGRSQRHELGADDRQQPPLHPDRVVGGDAARRGDFPDGAGREPDRRRPERRAQSGVQGRL